MFGAIASGVLGAGMGMFELIQGAIQTKKGNQLLSAFDRQELTNAYENIGISTYGSDLIREETARNSASMIDAARSGGSRSIMGALGSVQEYTNTNNARAAADLDNQAVKRDYSVAQDDVRIQQMQEQRDNMELSNIASMINGGNQDTHKGLGTIMNAGMGSGNALSPEEGNKTSLFGGFGGSFGGGFGGSPLNYTLTTPSI
jgi:hypothetical protein